LHGAAELWQQADQAFCEIRKILESHLMSLGK
jgi:hypothetical protein